MTNDIEEFCSIVTKRSQENLNSLLLLLENGNFSIAIGLLRQELDSLIRVAYLCDINPSKEEAKELISNMLQGKQWKKLRNNKSIRITDREMINLASKIGGWVEIIYSFGNKLIHLSDMHSNNPTKNITIEEKNEIIKYLSDYHQYPYKDINKVHIEEYLPKIMKKLVENVAFYVEEIKKSNK